MRHLASHGFVVIAPSTADHRAVPLSWEYAQTLLGALQFAAFEAARPGSLLEGRVDALQSGAMGHSMGAGNAVVAASLSGDRQWAASLGADWPYGPASLLNFDAEPWPNVRAFVGLGVAPIVAPVACLAGLRAHTLMFTPEFDRFVAPDAQRSLFEALPPAAPRQLAVIRGGGHCWLDEPRDGSGWGLPTSQCEQAERDPHFTTPQAQVSAKAHAARRATCINAPSTSDIAVAAALHHAQVHCCILQRRACPRHRSGRAGEHGRVAPRPDAALRRNRGRLGVKSGVILA